MLTKTKKLYVALFTVFLAAALCCSAILFTVPAQADAANPIGLSDFGGDFEDAAWNWIETSAEGKPEGENYIGEYDFAANGNRLDLEYELKLTNAGGQMWMVFGADHAAKTGLNVVLHTGASGGTTFGALVTGGLATDTALTGLGLNNFSSTMPPVEGRVYLLELSIVLGTDKAATISFAITDTETEQTVQVWDSVAFTLPDSFSGSGVWFFFGDYSGAQAGGTNVGLKDAGVVPVEVDPEEDYVVTATERPESNTVEAQNIEDFMETVAVYTRTSGALVDEDGNFMIDAVVDDDRNPNISFKSKENSGKYTGNYGIKFRTVNDMADPATAEPEMDPTYNAEQKRDTNTDIWFEFDSAKFGDSYVSQTGAPAIRFFYNADSSESRLIQLYPNGISGGNMQSVDLKTLTGYTADFLPLGEEYTLEAGRFVTKAADGSDLYTYYIEITNSSDVKLYVQCTFGGDTVTSSMQNGGFLRIATASYVRTAPVSILPIDESTYVTAKYAPAYEEAANVVDHDISDYLPIGQDGVTYTSDGSADVDIINAHGLINNSKNEMYMSFSGDYELTLAFFTDRYEDGNCTAGYQIIFTPDEITIQSYAGSVTAYETKAYTMPENTKVKITVRLVMLFIDGLSMGERLSLYIGDETEPFLTGDYDLQGSTLPTYFDGILSGTGSVSIYPADTAVTATNGLALTIDEDETVEVGSQLRLEAETTKEIIGDTITYKITEGSDCAEIVYNDTAGRYYLRGVKDGVVKVVAVVENEYGTFESEAVAVQIGEGSAGDSGTDPGNGGGDGEETGGGCNSQVTFSALALCLPAAAAAAVAILRKRAK